MSTDDEASLKHESDSEIDGSMRTDNSLSWLTTLDTQRNERHYEEEQLIISLIHEWMADLLPAPLAGGQANIVQIMKMNEQQRSST